MVLEAIAYAGDSIQLILHTTEFKFSHPSADSCCVSEKELAQISTLKTPNKEFAILRKKEISDFSEQNKLTLALDGVQDPGNMGTILRIADWFGISTIVCSKNTVECHNPKVVQASMGAIFRVQIAYVDLAQWLKKQSVPIYGALLSGESIYAKQELKNGILLLGNEGNGISEDILPFITHPIAIPRIGQAESLNVSVAAGILVSEFIRRTNS